MMTTPITPALPESPARLAARHVFDRVLVGVDGTPQGFDACREAARLAGRESRLEVVTVQLVEGLPEESARIAGAALDTATRILGPHAEARRLYGLVVPRLLEEVEATDATLLAIGSHEHPRVEEILLGGVAGELLHQAPCSVLLARPVPDGTSFPRSIVVGVDGSEEAELALEVARRLARRGHGSLHGLVAYGGKRVDLGPIMRRHPRLKTSPKGAVGALVEASRSADLVVVGSRGLHGPRALGSVSERVAHQAECPVLVVRRR